MNAAATHPTFASPRASRLALRLFWKEVRMLRGLALGTAVMALLLMWMVGVFAPPGLSVQAVFLAIPFGAAALFAIAAVVTLFSVEHEEGTHTLLQTLPQRPVTVFFSKMLAVVAMILALLVLLTLAGYASPGVQWPSDATMIVTQGGVVILEALVWGTLVALLCPYPLLAAMLGIAAASVNSQLAMALTLNNYHGFTPEDFQAAVPGRLGLLAVGAALDVWLGLRWLNHREASKPRRLSGVVSSAIDAVSVKRWLPLGAFGRLFWQTLRQSWKTAIAGLLLGLFLSSTYGLILGAFRHGEAIALAWLFAPALVGALVFRADQRRRSYRFLAEHAGRPRTLWLARHAAWGLMVALFTLAIVVLSANWFAGGIYEDWIHSLTWRNNFPDSYDSLQAHRIQLDQGYQVIGAVGLLLLSAALSAYAVGQFFSMALRSEIFAGLLALGASMLICAWALFVAGWRLPALWFVAPIGLGAMLATWLRVRDWMFERAGLVRWVLPLLALAAPIVLVLARTPAERWSQVKHPFRAAALQSSSFNLATATHEAEQQVLRGREVADAYSRLAGEVVSREPLTRNSEEIVQEISDLSQVDCRLAMENAPRTSQQIATLIEFMLPGQQCDLDERPLEANREPRDLDFHWDLLLACQRMRAQFERGYHPWDAINHHVFWLGRPLSAAWLDWATAEGQTPDRIRQAIDQLAALERQAPNPVDWLVNDYLRARSVVREETAPSFFNRQDGGVSTDEWLMYLANRLPGERQRAERALEILLEEQVALVAATNWGASAPQNSWHAARWREAVAGLRYRLSGDATLLANAVGERRPWETLQVQMRRVADARTSWLASSEFTQPHTLVRMLFEWVADDACRRAERVRLALVAYRLQHGDYPDSLAALSPEFLTPAQYNDPYSDESFGYSKAGFENVAFYRDRRRQVALEVASRVPVLWCVGVGNAKPITQTLSVAYGDDGQPIRLARDEDEAEDDKEVAEVRTETVTRLITQSDDGRGGEFWLPLPE